MNIFRYIPGLILADWPSHSLLGSSYCHLRQYNGWRSLGRPGKYRGVIFLLGGHRPSFTIIAACRALASQDHVQRLPNPVRSLRTGKKLGNENEKGIEIWYFATRWVLMFPSCRLTAKTLGRGRSCAKDFLAYFLAYPARVFGVESRDLP